MNRPDRPYRWLLVQLDESDLADLIGATDLELHPPVPAAQRRARELGPLAAILAALPLHPGLPYPIPLRDDYDHARPDGAPSSDTLARRHGSWPRACARAYGIRQDGSYIRKNRWRGGQPWINPNRGRTGTKQYSRDEVLEAIRQCAADLGRTPTQQRYREWSAAQHRSARGRGQRCRVPSLEPIYRYFPSRNGGWKAAVVAAFNGKQRS